MSTPSSAHPASAPGPYDFVVLLDRSRGRGYSRVLDSPAGTASEENVVPKRLESAAGAPPERALLGAIESKYAALFGEDLFGILMPGEVGSLYRRSRDIARRSGRSLRVVIRAEDPLLVGLPWELARDGGDGTFLAQSAGTPIVRGVPRSRPYPAIRPADIGAVVGVMVLLGEVGSRTAPADQAGTFWATPSGRQKVQVYRFMPDLVSRLSAADTHVVHLVAPIDRDPDTSLPVVRLLGDTGVRRPVGADHLASILGDARQLRLVVLHAPPPGEGTWAVDQASRLAEILVAAGVPNVVVVTDPLTDADTRNLVGALHDAVATAEPLERAMALARKSLALDDDLAWASPVLYVAWHGVPDPGSSADLSEPSPQPAPPPSPSPTVGSSSPPSPPTTGTGGVAETVREWLRRRRRSRDEPDGVPVPTRVAAIVACTTVEQIADPRLWADYDPAADAYSLIGRFRPVSADVTAALQLTSLQARRDALLSAHARLFAVQSELVARTAQLNPPPDAPVLLAGVIGWQDVLMREAVRLTEQSFLMAEIDSPYIVGVPLRQESVFVGREDLSRRLEVLLPREVTPALLLYGQRRMGKTSLLNNLGRFLPTDVVPMFVDLQGPPAQADSEGSFLFQLARAMTTSAMRNRPELVLSTPTREQFFTAPFERFYDWLDHLQASLGRRTALLMLDEFEALERSFSAGRLDPDAVLGMVRHLIQHRPGLKVLLAGSHTLDTYSSWSGYLINVQVLKVDYLDPASAEELVRRPVPDFPLEYDDDAVAAVLGLTRGHPYLLQLLCAEVVTGKNEQEPARRRRATLADVNAAAEAALDSGAMYFHDVEHTQIGPAARDLVLRIAAGEPGAGTAPEDRATLRELRQRDLVEPGPDGPVVQVELIRRWLERSANS